MIGSIIASIAVAILKAWFSRLDLQNASQAKVLSEFHDLTEQAAKWLEDAMRDPARAATLISLYPDVKIILGPSTTTDSTSATNTMPPGRSG